MIETSHLPRRGIGGAGSPEGYRLVIAPWSDFTGTFLDAFATLRPALAPGTIWMASRHPVQAKGPELATRLLRNGFGRDLIGASLLHVELYSENGDAAAILVSDITDLPVCAFPVQYMPCWFIADAAAGPSELAAILSDSWSQKDDLLSELDTFAPLGRIVGCRYAFDGSYLQTFVPEIRRDRLN